MNQQLFKKVHETYARLLPDVKYADIQSALEECYVEGMTEKQLTKETYAYIYLVKDPTLY